MLRVQHQILRSLSHPALRYDEMIRIQFSAKGIFSRSVKIDLSRRDGRSDTVCPPVRKITRIGWNIAAPSLHLMKKLLKRDHPERHILFKASVQLMRSSGNFKIWRSIIRNGAGYHKRNEIIRILFPLKIFKVSGDPGHANSEFFLVHISGIRVENGIRTETRGELIMEGIVRSRMRTQKHLVSQMIVVAVPHKNLIALRGFPVIRSHFPVKREHAMMRMERCIKITDSMTIQNLRIAPGKAVDIRAHSGRNRTADGFRILVQFLHHIVERFIESEIRHVKIVSGKADLPGFHIGFEFYLLFLTCVMIKLFDLPEILTLPDESLIFLFSAGVAVIQRFNCLTYKRIMISGDLFLPFGITDVRMRMVNQVDHPFFIQHFSSSNHPVWFIVFLSFLEERRCACSIPLFLIF